MYVYTHSLIRFSADNISIISYCRQCNYKHWLVSIFLTLSFSYFGYTLKGEMYGRQFLEWLSMLLPPFIQAFMSTSPSKCEPDDRDLSLINRLLQGRCKAPEIRRWKGYAFFLLCCLSLSFSVALRDARAHAASCVRKTCVASDWRRSQLTGSEGLSPEDLGNRIMPTTLWSA